MGWLGGGAKATCMCVLGVVQIGGRLRAGANVEGILRNGTIIGVDAYARIEADK